MDQEIKWALESLRRDACRALAWSAMARADDQVAPADWLHDQAGRWLAEAKLLQGLASDDEFGEQLELADAIPAA